MPTFSNALCSIVGSINITTPQNAKENSVLQLGEMAERLDFVTSGFFSVGTLAQVEISSMVFRCVSALIETM